MSALPALTPFATALIPQRLRIATRESRLAMWQTEHVAARLLERHPGIAIEIAGMTTKGDRILDRPLAQVGGKGLFIKELEVALADNLADIAVHSMKDVPMEMPEGFAMLTFGPREDARDAFVSLRHEGLAALPAGAVVGTSSLRRECQLRRAHPALVIRPLRGNVNTRLAKLDSGEYDAIILAAAGLKRLGFGSRIRELLPLDLALPAIGQGVLAIEYLADRADVAELLSPFVDPAAQAAAEAERALGLVVEGSCEVPVGGHAMVQGQALVLEGFLGLPDGSRLVRERIEGTVGDAAKLGRELGERILARGRREVLDLLAPPKQ
ncbi:MAG: hydroxymethylbilane synthase [Betaproteobacteria bacterium]|nr:hydroxymethylbilane synthase [Betaproteobacteria bacterium]